MGGGDQDNGRVGGLGYTYECIKNTSTWRDSANTLETGNKILAQAGCKKDHMESDRR